jgi:hypothetical protein
LAIVNYSVDHNGRGRHPTIVRASEPAFGSAPQAGIQQWGREPACIEGTPVIALEHPSFRFAASSR